MQGGIDMREQTRRKQFNWAAQVRRGLVGIQAERPKAVGTYAIGSFALGALATGAIAVGTVAIGRLAVGRLALREGRIKYLRIDELEVGKYRLLNAEPEAATASNGHNAAEPAVAVRA
jgi:hypothetical protein